MNSPTRSERPPETLRAECLRLLPSTAIAPANSPDGRHGSYWGWKLASNWMLCSDGPAYSGNTRRKSLNGTSSRVARRAVSISVLPCDGHRRHISSPVRGRNRRCRHPVHALRADCGSCGGCFGDAPSRRSLVAAPLGGGQPAGDRSSICPGSRWSPLRWATREDLWLGTPVRDHRRAEVRDGDGTLSTDISGNCRRQAVPLISHRTCPRAKHETTSSALP